MKKGKSMHNKNNLWDWQFRKETWAETLFTFLLGLAAVVGAVALMAVMMKLT
jgi:hypothetical protein